MDDYPRWLEEWWLNRACETLGAREPGECLRRLESDVQRLSDLLTVERVGAFGAYSRDERLLLAYGLFFFPQTYARIQFPLEEAIAFRGWRPRDGHSLAVLDLGAGLGASALGMASWLLADDLAATIQLTALDQSEPSLAGFQEIAHGLGAHWPRATFTSCKGDLGAVARWPTAPEGGWDLIVCSLALNEAFHGAPLARVQQWTRAAMEQLNPSGLLLILEPALRETSERLEQLRDGVAREGRCFIWAPCLHHQECPLLEAGKFWCHEVREWNPPPALEHLNRRLFREIQVLKFSFLVLGRCPPSRPSANAAQCRLVSPVSAMKGRLVFTACAGDGQSHACEMPTRHLAKSDLKRVSAIRRGDIVQVDSATAHHGVLRLPGPEAIRPIYPTPGPA